MAQSGSPRYPRHDDRALARLRIRPPCAWLLEALALALWLTAPDVGADAPVQIAFIQFIVAGVVEAFRWLADKAVTVAIVVWHATKIVGLALWNFSRALGGVFGKAYNLLERFWGNVLRPLIGWTWRNIERLQLWLKQTFGPLLRFLELLRRRLYEIYDKYFRPIFDTIEVMRRTLQLLAALRLEWARELDRKLAELEDRLLFPLREAMLRLNQVSEWVNRIITLDGLLQRVTLLRSLWRDVEAQWRMLVHARSKDVTDQARAGVQQQMSQRTMADVRRDLTAVMMTGDGPYGPGAREIAAIVEASMRRAP